MIPVDIDVELLSILLGLELYISLNLVAYWATCMARLNPQSLVSVVFPYDSRLTPRQAVMGIIAAIVYVPFIIWIATWDFIGERM